MTRPSLTAPFANTSQLSKGGSSFTYIAASEVIERLNAVLGYDGWSYECEVVHMDSDFVCVKGRLSALGVVKEQFGGQSINKKRDGSIIDLGDDLKGASSDAFKKAAQMLGVALGLALGRNPTPFSASPLADPEEVTHPRDGGSRADQPPITDPSPPADSSTNENQGETAPLAAVAASNNDALVGGDPAEDGLGEAPSSAGQSDSPEDLLKKAERQKLIQRFNDLPLEQKAQAMAFKRTLKLANWFSAGEEAVAAMEAKVSELEAAAV